MRVRSHDATGTLERDERWVAPLFHSEITSTEQACCCPAPAAYAVVLAPSAGQAEPPELLLCGHHLRASRERLAELGAAVYDVAGCFVELG